MKYKPSKPTANTALIVLAAATILAVLGIGTVAYVVGVSNDEKRLRVTITQKQTDNQSQFDNMTKKIMQSAQVTQEQAKAVAALVRTPPAGPLLTAVREAIPNLDQSTYKLLMNIITSSRDSFTQRQTELLDLKREHDLFCGPNAAFPRSLITGGRPQINVTVVTSSKAEEAFATGKDDDTKLFK